MNKCHTLKPDGMWMDIDEKIMPKSEWTDMQAKDISMKMQFWWNKWMTMDDKISKIKAMVRMK